MTSDYNVFYATQDQEILKDRRRVDIA